jgi:hypothetical protein
VVKALLNLATSALFLWMGQRVAHALRDVRNWPTVPGRVLERGVGQALGGCAHTPHVKYT